MPGSPELWKTFMVGVATALVTASLAGSVLLFKEHIQVQQWILQHERIAEIHIEHIRGNENTIKNIQEKLRTDDNWDRKDHDEFVKDINSRCAAFNQRINYLERKSDLMEFKLGDMDEKLDEILERLSK